MAYQQDTLVLREHRGHGLGLALKAATHAGPRRRVARGCAPSGRGTPTTNGPMIAVNEALGYRTTAIAARVAAAARLTTRRGEAPERPAYPVVA